MGKKVHIYYLKTLELNKVDSLWITGEHFVI